MTDSMNKPMRMMGFVAAIAAGATMAVGALAVMVAANQVRLDHRYVVPTLAAGFTLSIPRLTPPDPGGPRAMSGKAEYSIAGA